MTSMNIPKRIDINLIRARKGDKFTETLIMQLYADKLLPTVKIKPELYEKTLALMTEGVHGAGSQMIPMVIRQWFGERPRNAAVFRVWLTEKLATLTPPEETPAPVKRRRAKRRKAA